MILHLLRHAASTAPTGVACGWTDWPLSMHGAAAAAAAAAAWNLAAPASIVTSDLARAVATATPFAARFGLACSRDSRLRETHLGEWEGHAWSALELAHPERLARWFEHWRSEGPPLGESFGDVLARVGEFLGSIDGTAPTLVVAHSGSIRALLVYSGAHGIDDAMNLPLPPLGGYTLSFRSGAAPICVPLDLAPGTPSGDGPA